MIRLNMVGGVGIKHIVSFSGGKDSTALLLMMLEKQMQIDEIIFCDTGKEFPAMYQHIKKVEQYIGMPITVLKPEKSFDYWMFEHVKTKGKRKGSVGYGWPMPGIRWCTAALKREVASKYLNEKYGTDYVEYIGYAFDEPSRVKLGGQNKLFPLYDWKITEAAALKYCYLMGFDWDGLYEHFNRVSCWCCPFQRIGELRSLYYFYQEIWQQLKDMDSRSFNNFSNRYTLDELELRFKNELCRKVI